VSVKQIVPGLYTILLGPVNAFLIDSDELTLIDTGYAKNTEKIMKAVQAIGRQPADIRHILITHCHPDHAGGLAAIKRSTNAPAYMHPADAAIVRKGKVPPHLKPAPGFINNILFRIFIGFGGAEYEAADVEYEIQDGDELAIAGGIQAIHVPGHCAGQLAFLWKEYNGVLFAADTASNMMGLGWGLGYEDLEESKRSLLKISALDFDIACFAHGKSIIQGASAKFKQKWGT
jgi:glyoxylase-like metal-dependent hydrolase (beta-lactamase superfamily II)